MSMKEWAEREIEIACEKEGNAYGCACYESAYKAFLSLLEDEHSGFSIQATKQILNRLIDGRALTPIEDTPDVWNEITCKTNDTTTYQCRRMSSLFKDVYSDGTIKYHDVDRFICTNKDCPTYFGWRSSVITNLVDKLYPITMPYYPHSKSLIVHYTEGLSDPANGDFDTVGIWFIVKPDGERETIERFYKESNDGWIEIGKEEYFDRVGNKEDES